MSPTKDTTRIIQRGATDFEVQYLKYGTWRCFKTPSSLERARVLRDELIEFGVDGIVIE